MSAHPNVILMAVLKPDGLSRKTMREILFNNEGDEHADDVKIGSSTYFPLIMEESYDDSLQISANEGDLVFLNMVTYGYGEAVEWDDLEMQKEGLEAWAKETSDKYHCSYTIRVTANYW